MCESALSLVELCLDAIVDHLDEVFEPCIILPDDISVILGRISTLEIIEISDMMFKFRDPDMYLFNELSEKLLVKLSEKKKLNDATLRIFSGKNTRLRNVKIKNSKMSYAGLKILREHKLNELECINMKHVSINKILDCLSDYSMANITHFNVSKCSFIDMSRHSLMVDLTNLTNLKSLNVSFTEFNQQTLQILCEDLKHLERLDISATCVQCAKPLLLIKDRLISLVASDLRNINQMTETIIELDSLRHLDISLINEKFDQDRRNIAICDILESTDKLSHLIYLDISGWRDLIPKSTMETFIDTHKKLKYLGLVLNPTAFEFFLSEPTYEHFVKDLIVAGLGNEFQIKVTLKKYYERHIYVQKALYHLFQLTNTFDECRSDIFELVLPAMAAHPTKFGVQMAATACIYNLTRGEVAKDINTKLLNRGVELTLNAMENYPDEYQLQKNALLTLCSDRILQDVAFDRFRCAKLVLDCLCAFDEVNMNRMSVAICSILAAKVSTTETSELGAKPSYMRKLLSMVQARVQNKACDITMKFTLSALWNLTDESASTCFVFLENDGADLFLSALQVFRGDATVETKVLGLLNNISEVETLRSNLMLEELMLELLMLLRSEHIEVSYFAAGIVAHLASDGEAKWVLVQLKRGVMLEELETAVKSWADPVTEMVSYRSFKPFFPLLRTEMDYAVQLWAVWAVHHVCKRNPFRYCRMLREENGVPILKFLLEGECNTQIKKLCLEILDFLNAILHF